ncbi:MAG: GxxExxY protein [Bacteroidetes bacterium]|nr:GxxExxY protein [Bacteroidota bacterium]
MPFPLTVKRGDLIYPELSYIIVGCLYEVWNELGPGHSERTYQKATAVMFAKKNLRFIEQQPAPVYFKEELLNNRFLDFLVEDKIVVELKKNESFSIGNIRQINDYLIRKKLSLAILANFTFKGVKTKRVININH